MRKISVLNVLLLIGLLMANISSAAAQNNSAQNLRDVQREVTRVNKNLSKAKKVSKDVEGISLEGTQAHYYYQNDVLQKISANIYGESYNVVLEVVYADGKPIFIYKKENFYNQPVGTNRSVKVVKSFIKRIYLKDGKVFRTTLNNKISTEEKIDAQDIIDIAEHLKQVSNR